MLNIKNIDKIIAINSQDIEIQNYNIERDFYEFHFTHIDINSTTFRAQLYRKPQWQGGNEYIMELWDGIGNNPSPHQFLLEHMKDPFALLSYLKDVINNWVMVTNK